jgi:hypothetical protein
MNVYALEKGAEATTATARLFILNVLAGPGPRDAVSRSAEAIED